MNLQTQPFEVGSKKGFLMDKAACRLECVVARRHYIGIFLLSFATLLLELSLTRVFSVASWYHFGFLVISTSLLGFGASGVTLSLWSYLRERAPLDPALAILSLAFGIVTLGSFRLMQSIPFDPFSMLLDKRQLIFTAVYFLMLAAPFFCSGMGIALLFTRGTSNVGLLYAADLLGAGLGCAALAIVMPEFGGSGSVVVAAAIGSLAAVVFGLSRARGLMITGVAISLTTIVLAFMAEQELPITVVSNKHHRLQPAGMAPIYTAWNSFSRVDVYELPPMPEAGRPDPGLGIIIDAGTAGTAIGDLSMGVRNYLSNCPQYYASGLPYVGKKHAKVLIIGSGAGAEVLEALYFGASSITAVEINPIINDIVTKRLSQYWGGLFQQPEVHLVTEDGRSFVRRSQEKYDAIISIQTMSESALTSGATTMAESYTCTREAFEDYLDHLTPEGVYLVTRTDFQIPRVFATISEVFERRGLGSPASHLFAFEGILAPFHSSQFISGSLFKKSPFTDAEIREMKERLGINNPSVWKGNTPPKIYYSPFDPPQTLFQVKLAKIATSTDLSEIYVSSDRLLSPATDDKPFFNQNIPLSSLRPWIFRRILSAGGKDANSGYLVGGLPVAEAMLVILLIQAIGIAAVLILLPLARFSWQGLRMPGHWSFLTYFACLGLGFIMIEVVLLQRFILFLGQPAYTFAVVLASLLVFTGAGSYVASLFHENSRRLFFLILLAIMFAICATLFLTPWVLSATLGFAFPWRVAISVALVAPLGVLLGMPFPTGLRMVANEASDLVPWAWGVNAFFTVIGSVSSMILGMALGFTWVLVIAGMCYLVALVAIAAFKAEQQLLYTE
jgi:spermidine synthase